MLPLSAGSTIPEFTVADPERALAVSYAPAGARGGLAALFALDERMGAIVAATTEPTIGLIRLAWWREALDRLDHAPPPAEPLLAEIAARLLPRGVTGAALSEIEDGWAALLESDIDEAAIARHGRARGGTLFDAAAIFLAYHAEHASASAAQRVPASMHERTRHVQGDGSRIATAGTAWALADLGHRHSLPGVRMLARSQARAALDALPHDRWPRPLRPLGALAALARHDAASTGNRAQGSPARLARMLALRLTGF